MTDNPTTDDPIGDTTPETAHALLYRHGLPEDVIDGALALFAQELAGKIRAWHDRLPSEHECCDGNAADLISPENWARHEPAAPVPPATRATNQAAPADWIDGHPHLEAIAAAMWEQCGRSEHGGCIDDDPRNIAVAALSAMQAVPVPPTTTTAVGSGRQAGAELYVLLRKAGEDRYEAQALIDRHRDEVLHRAELRRLADEAQQQAETDLIEEYLWSLRGQGPEPDLSDLPPNQREAIKGQFEIVKALADRDPKLPPLDQDPVAQRLELHASAAGAQQQPDTETPDDLATARATNQRLNLRAQQLESELAAYRRAVAQWEVSERGTYVPLRTLAAIARAAGSEIETPQWLLHYQRVEQAEAAIERVRQAVNADSPLEKFMAGDEPTDYAKGWAAATARVEDALNPQPAVPGRAADDEEADRG
ncbi:hypothetical protein AB0C88_37755 [Streptomyces chartreusis]|uniref:hypothetical protein n=1 Tax=Streptomyces chartreusis TaxID=1969 RepID=UPI0033E8809A